LLQNSLLLSRRASTRNLGSIAKQKKDIKESPHRHSSVELILGDEEDPMAPLVVLSDEDNSTSLEVSMTESTSLPLPLECPPHHESQVKDSNPLNRSPEEQNPQRSQEFTTEPEIVPMPERAEKGARPEEYRIDPEDNSVVSNSSFDERPICKRRFRKKHLHNESSSQDDPHHDDDAEESIGPSTDVPQCVQRDVELASAVLEESRVQEKPSTFSMDKTDALKKLTLVAPTLYKAVVDRLGGIYEMSGINDAPADDGVGIKQDQVSQTLPSMPPPPTRKCKTESTRTCSSLDKAYWTDNSRDYVS